MSAFGDLLEAMHDAPRATSFRGRARQGTDLEKLREAHERMNRRRGSHSALLVAISGRGDVAPRGIQEAMLEFWYSSGDWRLDHREMRTIGTDEGVLRFHRSGMGAVVTAVDEQPTAPFDGFSHFFAPSMLLGSARIASQDEAVHLGRPCWRVSTEIVESPHMHFSPMLRGGEDFEHWVDQELGIIVRSEGRLDGELASTFEIDELVVGQAIEPEVFAFVTPDGSPIRTQGEMQLEHLRARGIDVSGIDPSDPQQVQQAMQASFPGPMPPLVPDVEQLAANHIPNGSPPEDEESARIDIGAAFEAMGVPSDDGTALPNVERGENLGPCAAEIKRRFPEQVANAPRTRIDKIKFLNAQEAVVWFTTVIPVREGRAVLVDGKWKVSRATYCALVGMGGVVCPPPLESG